MPFRVSDQRVVGAFIVGVVCGFGIREVCAACKRCIQSKLVMKGFDQMPELSRSGVHMKNPENVKEMINKIVQGGKDRLQVIADFDRTLTKFAHAGKLVPTCHGIMDSSKLLPKDYRDNSDALRAKYYAIEVDHDMTTAQKIPYMIEWWTKAHDLMAELQIKQDDIHNIVFQSDLRLRDGCEDMFNRLEELNVPLLIFSAGIGDVIYEGIKKCATYHPNMKIVSNFMDFNGQGIMTGFHGDLIHSFNKNENAIHDSEYFQELSHRHNVILLGDSMGDLGMADGAEADVCLKIGYLNDKIEERLETYMNAWDIVLVNDGSMDVTNAILRCI